MDVRAVHTICYSAVSLPNFLNVDKTDCLFLISSRHNGQFFNSSHILCRTFNNVVNKQSVVHKKYYCVQVGGAGFIIQTGRANFSLIFQIPPSVPLLIFGARVIINATTSQNWHLSSGMRVDNNNKQIFWSTFSFNEVKEMLRVKNWICYKVCILEESRREEVINNQ
ncbi:hypothetical protein EGR_04628 [Echinococcus granulosus]|uniref:Uncharacterized protein n=1 Tax=Echinococcus granulosus TaxID=6210 RepID=W6V347_ECHGR|nr:hypothetical protein EGR_04628 [Echinococcus granulosus]EUB60434.1 hypothetical protein EGR_04628 [Echinococcus granulosus]